MQIIQYIIIFVTLILSFIYSLVSSLFLIKIDNEYYKSPLNGVYYQGDFEGVKYYSKINGLNAKKFKIISCENICYGKQDDKLYYGKYFVNDADPESFSLMGTWVDRYARDKNSVFYLDDADTHKLDGVNPDEFYKAGWAVWKYKDSCYQYGKLIDCSNTNLFNP